MSKHLFPITLLSLLWSLMLPLGATPRASLITCGQSREFVFYLYGHTAIRITDPETGLDKAYNYGYFSMEQKNFIPNFMIGKPMYMLGVTDFDSMVYDYAAQGRRVSEQQLNLRPDEVQALMDFLDWNALPENAEYRYNYFYDNCATRPRDLIERFTKGGLVYRVDPASLPTFREATRQCSKSAKWYTFGTDLCLGVKSDARMTVHDAAFVPELLEQSMDLLALHMTAGTPPSVSAGISPELLDSYVLLDRAVAQLMELLDRKFGKGEVLVALAGNGMARCEPIRDDKKRYPTFSPERCRAITNMYLHAKYGVKGMVTEVTDRGELFLDRKVVEQREELSLAEVQDAVCSFLLEMAGVAYTIPNHSLKDLLPGDPVGRNRLTALHSALPSQRADVFVGISPGYLIDTGTATPQPSYTAMPTMLILMGEGIEPEVIHTPLDLRGVSHEISRVLRIRPPTP